MDERDRHMAEERAAQRIQYRDQPAVAVAAVDPDQHPPSRFDGAGHLLQRPLRIFEMMDDADREGDVEALGKGQIIGARSHDLDRRKAGEVAPRAGERALIDIDRAALARPVGHRPEAIAAHAAPDIDKAPAGPVPRREVDRPTTELLLVFGPDLGIGAPLIAETVGRTPQIAGSLVDQRGTRPFNAPPQRREARPHQPAPSAAPPHRTGYKEPRAACRDRAGRGRARRTAPRSPRGRTSRRPGSRATAGYRGSARERGCGARRQSAPRSRASCARRSPAADSGMPDA